MIAGDWKRVVRDGKVGPTAHFVARGAVWAVCGAGRPAPLGKARAVSFAPAAGHMTHRCEQCLACITATLRRRKETKQRFEALLKRLERREPAVAQQIAMAWPAHAQEDHSAEWWSDSAPAIIIDMKEALR